MGRAGGEDAHWAAHRAADERPVARWGAGEGPAARRAADERPAAHQAATEDPTARRAVDERPVAHWGAGEDPAAVRQAADERPAVPAATWTAGDLQRVASSGAVETLAMGLEEAWLDAAESRAACWGAAARPAASSETAAAPTADEPLAAPGAASASMVAVMPAAGAVAARPQRLAIEHRFLRCLPPELPVAPPGSPVSRPYAAAL